MGLGILELTPELFVEFSKASKSGFPRKFTVIENPLPDDAQVIGMEEPTLTGNWRLVISSESYPDGAPVTIQPPVYETIFDE